MIVLTGQYIRLNQRTLTRTPRTSRLMSREPVFRRLPIVLMKPIISTPAAPLGSRQKIGGGSELPDNDWYSTMLILVPHNAPPESAMGAALTLSVPSRYVGAMGMAPGRILGFCISLHRFYTLPVNVWESSFNFRKIMASNLRFQLSRAPHGPGRISGSPLGRGRQADEK
jgi:hypothetical protein